VKKTLLILSILLISCERKNEFIKVPLLVRDDENKVCAEYQLVDVKNVTYELKQEHPIDFCKNIFGFTPHDFKQVQNWIRDEIKSQQKTKQVTP